MTRILLVEDESALSEPLSFLLEREGYEVTVAEDGPTAISEFDQNGADLILLDLMLPGIPGTEVCREVRTRSTVPIIMLTAKDSEIDIVVGLELGADDYVTKPYSTRELVARIRAVLRRREDQSETDGTPDGYLPVASSSTGSGVPTTSATPKRSTCISNASAHGLRRHRRIRSCSSPCAASATASKRSRRTADTVQAAVPERMAA